MNSVRLKSFAKINLTLDVHLKRPDGYHDIESVMQTISLHDIITVEKVSSQEITVETDSESIPSGERNLAYRAAVLLREAGKLVSGVRIYIEKNIPAQAGLGGGSSNGAAVLVGLNRLYNLGLDTEELSSYAASIGSDAAFFMDGGTALAEGRGERLTQLPDAPEMHLVVVKPDVGVPTPWAYSELDSVPDRKPGKSTGFMIEAIKSGDIRRIADCMSNDFEQVVLPGYPEINDIKKRLLDLGAKSALLAGSGAAVFGVFEDNMQALEGSRHLQDLGQVFTTKTISKAEAADAWL